MSSNTPLQHSEPPMSIRHPQEDGCGVCHPVSHQETLVAFVGFSVDHKASLPPSKSCNSLGGSSEDSTHALTDCSSLQDLDLSFEDKDPLPSPPEFGYWKRLDEDDVRKGRHPFLPSVLSREPQTSRTVSFSSVEEVFGEEGAEAGLRPPKTPTIDWYASKGSTQELHEFRHYVPLLSSAASPLRKQRQQPRRSALKKTDSTPPLPIPCLACPVSPMVTWYSSKK